MADGREGPARAAGARRYKFEKSAWAEPPARLRHVDLTLKIFDGARHEILNELNREETEETIIGFIADRLAKL